MGTDSGITQYTLTGRNSAVNQGINQGIKLIAPQLATPAFSIAKIDV
jgi:hypothetical protein